MNESSENLKDSAASDNSGGSTFCMDGAYANLVTGLGLANADKDEHTVVNMNTRSDSWQALAAQYVNDGIVKRICAMPPEKALKAPIVINGDKDDAAFKALSKLGFFEAVKTAGNWARLFGGSIIVTVYEGDDNADLSKEPSMTAKVAGYRVYSLGKINLTEGSLCTDKKSRWYGNVELWEIQRRMGDFITVHASRVTIFKGDSAPDILDDDIYYYIFGCSVITMANDGIKKLPGAFGSLSNMLQENGLSIFGINGLTAMLSKPGGVQKVIERMSIIKRGMSTLHGVIQDKEDTFDMKSHSMGDVPESVKLIMAYISAETGFPVSILFGNMVSGLSSTNEGDIRQMDDLVEQWRNTALYKPMCAMITDYMNRNEKRGGEFDFQFGAVYQATPNEKADLMEKKGNFCKNLYDMGAMTPKEIRQNLVVNGGTDDVSVASEDVPKAGE